MLPFQILDLDIKLYNAFGNVLNNTHIKLTLNGILFFFWEDSEISRLEICF